MCIKIESVLWRSMHIQSFQHFFIHFTQILVPLQGTGCTYRPLYFCRVSHEEVTWSSAFFSPLCSCLLQLKGDAAKFKPCYSWTKRHVRANLVRNCISAQRGSCGSKSINFLSSGTDDLFYCSSMTVWNEIGFHIWTAVKNILAL